MEFPFILTSTFKAFGDSELLPVELYNIYSLPFRYRCLMLPGMSPKLNHSIEGNVIWK